MARQSCGFSVLAPAEKWQGDKMRFSVILIAALFLVPTFEADAQNKAVGARTLTSMPSPSPSGLSETELNAPSYDVQWRKPVQEAQVGDELELKVVGLPMSKELKLDVPAEAAEMIGKNWEVLLRETNQPIPEGEFWFMAVPIKAGSLILPSLVFKDPQGKILARTNPFSVKVASAIRPDDPNPNESVEIHPPVSLEFPWWIITAISLIALLCISGIVYALYVWSQKKRKIPEAAEPAPPPRPEDEVALETLAEIEKSELMKKGQYKLYYFKVSEVLKTYLGARYRFDAPESTSYEIVQHFEQRKTVSDLILDKVETLLNELDRVKFTDYVPDLGEADKILQDVKQLVLTTRRPKQEVVTAGLGVPGGSGRAGRAS